MILTRPAPQTYEAELILAAGAGHVLTLLNMLDDGSTLGTGSFRWTLSAVDRFQRTLSENLKETLVILAVWISAPFNPRGFPLMQTQPAELKRLPGHCGAVAADDALVVLA